MGPGRITILPAPPPFPPPLLPCPSSQLGPMETQALWMMLFWESALGVSNNEISAACAGWPSSCLPQAEAKVMRDRGCTGAENDSVTTALKVRPAQGIGGPCNRERHHLEGYAGQRLRRAACCGGWLDSQTGHQKFNAPVGPWRAETLRRGCSAQGSA